MNITILVKGKETRYGVRFSARKAMSAVVLMSLVMLVSSRSTDSVYENQIRLNVVKTGLKEQVALVEKLQLDTELQVDGMVSELAQMHAKINRLDLLSEGLADKIGLDPTDFVLPEDLKQGIVSEHRLSLKAERLSQALEFKIAQLDALESILIGLNIEKESVLAGRPIEKGWLSSYYGIRKDPFNGKPAMHKGIDFAGKAGSGVIATGAGVVTWAGERYGYGNLVEIDHGNGLKTRYGHNDTITVSTGDLVTKGQIIAKMGNTGRSTGAHVHYEVLENGRQVDPLPHIYK